MSSSVTIRRSGLQQEVINLYRQCFRAARLKSPSTRTHFYRFIRQQFHQHNVQRTDIATIEHLLRKGRKQLEIFSHPSVEDVNL